MPFDLHQKAFFITYLRMLIQRLLRKEPEL